MFPRGALRRLLARLGVALRPAPYRGARGVGQRWERLAASRLRRAGYRILERNFRGRSGEIDLVAEERGVLCFVEVKGRGGAGFGAPEDAVTALKQRRIARVAEEYRLRRRVPETTVCRFDVVAIRDADGCAEVAIIRDAFVASGERGGDVA